jgi:hypothetical protein
MPVVGNVDDQVDMPNDEPIQRNIHDSPMYISSTIPLVKTCSERAVSQGNGLLKRKGPKSHPNVFSRNY